MQADVSRYVNTCDLCQLRQLVQLFVKNCLVTYSAPFNLLSIYITGLLSTTKEVNLFILVCVKQPTGWQIIRTTKNKTVSVVIPFMEEEIIPPFVALRLSASKRRGFQHA